jgi:hypothetical protein
MIDGDAFVAAVTAKGTEIDKVIHLGRKPTVLQRTALEWFAGGECSIDRCTSPARIEIDGRPTGTHPTRRRQPRRASPKQQPKATSSTPADPIARAARPTHPGHRDPPFLSRIPRSCRAFLSPAT